ncbi:hypothetical protein AcV7_004929 [Taiwanofungus camphoratus]|nr:hypothetical protein AcV7_004929 [Antrodia cinnamomea]
MTDTEVAAVASESLIDEGPAGSVDAEGINGMMGNEVEKGMVIVGNEVGKGMVIVGNEVGKGMVIVGNEVGKAMGIVGNEVGKAMGIVGNEVGKAMGIVGNEVGKAMDIVGNEVGKAMGIVGNEVGKGMVIVGNEVGKAMGIVGNEVGRAMGIVGNEVGKAIDIVGNEVGRTDMMGNEEGKLFMIGSEGLRSTKEGAVGTAEGLMDMTGAENEDVVATGIEKGAVRTKGTETMEDSMDILMEASTEAAGSTTTSETEEGAAISKDVTEGFSATMSARLDIEVTRTASIKDAPLNSMSWEGAEDATEAVAKTLLKLAVVTEELPTEGEKKRVIHASSICVRR